MPHESPRLDYITLMMRMFSIGIRIEFAVHLPLCSDQLIASRSLSSDPFRPAVFRTGSFIQHTVGTQFFMSYETFQSYFFVHQNNRCYRLDWGEIVQEVPRH